MARDEYYFGKVDWSGERILTQAEISAARSWINTYWLPQQMRSREFFPDYSGFASQNTHKFLPNRGWALLCYLANPFNSGYQTGCGLLQETIVCDVLNKVMPDNSIYPAPQWIDAGFVQPSAGIYQKGGDLVVCSKETGEIRYVLDVTFKTRKYRHVPGSTENTEWIGMNSHYGVPVIVLSVGEGFRSDGSPVLSDGHMHAIRDGIVLTGNLTVAPQDIDVDALTKSFASGVQICGETLQNALQSGQYGELTECMRTCYHNLTLVDVKREFGKTG